MNTEIIQKLIINEILPNNNKYLKDNIICSLEGNNILIQYKKIIYSLKATNNNLILSHKNKTIIKFNINTSFEKIIEYIKNIQ